MDEVSYIVRKILAGHESSQGAPRDVDHGLAFKMTLQADRVSLAGRQLSRIEDEAGPAAGQVCRGISMTGLASDTAVEEWPRSEMIVGAKGRLHAGGVTVKATSIDLEGEWHFRRVDGFWVHIPHALLAIPVHRAFEPIAVLLKQVSAASLAGAHEIAEFLLSLESVLRGRIGPLIT